MKNIDLSQSAMSNLSKWPTRSKEKSKDVGMIQYQPPTMRQPYQSSVINIATSFLASRISAEYYYNYRWINLLRSIYTTRPFSLAKIYRTVFTGVYQVIVEYRGFEAEFIADLMPTPCIVHSLLDIIKVVYECWLGLYSVA